MTQDDEKSSSEDEILVESLVQGRARRSTAGQHMSALLDAEADDELALLFEEIEDDNEFDVDIAEDGAEEDERLDSSSDEEDQGPNAQAGDLEGERQIEKDEREAKKKKRAREDLRYGITSKKVKIGPTAPVPTTPAPRLRKKSERVSWIPTVDEGPTRSSSRRQTMHNKELTHARLKDSEEKRVRLIATMEEAAKRKAKLKPKGMTQSQHLAEAERVEKHNSKSLNRWEEMEKRKAEERRAKIEALQNRRLEGPVISYWSGVATWSDGRLTRVGKVNITPKPEKEDSSRKKSKKADKEGKIEAVLKSNNDTKPVISQTAPPIPSDNLAGPAATAGPKPDQVTAQPAQQLPAATGQGNDTEPDKDHLRTQGDISSAPSEPTVHPKPGGLLPTPTPSILPDLETTVTSAEEKSGEPEATRVTEPISVTEDGMRKEAVDDSRVHNATSQSGEASTEKENKLPDEVSFNLEGDPMVEAQNSVGTLQPTQSTQPTSESSTVLLVPNSQIPIQPKGQANGQTNPLIPVQSEQKPDIHIDQPAITNTDAFEPAEPPRPLVVEHTGRSLTVLENFDDKTAQSREFNIYFNAKKPPRLTKISSSLCVITSLPSRYRDPDTSLPFANSYAYHEIRHTAAQKYSWSPMLGCYVAPTGVAARGVPERFLNPNAKESSSKFSSAEEPNIPAKEEESAKTVGSLSTPTSSTPAAPAAAPPPPPAAAGTGDGMDIDK
ncbi:YL1 nuclear protein-domain-containing protein [Aspergillus californicus]